jgi:hypothetical protein
MIIIEFGMVITDIVTLQPGQVLFEKGEAGRHMYVIQSGGFAMPPQP